MNPHPDMNHNHKWSSQGVLGTVMRGSFPQIKIVYPKYRHPIVYYIGTLNPLVDNGGYLGWSRGYSLLGSRQTLNPKSDTLNPKALKPQANLNPKP